MELGRSLLCTQKPATRPDYESDEYSSRPCTPSLYDPFQYHSVYFYVLQVILVRVEYWVKIKSYTNPLYTVVSRLLLPPLSLFQILQSTPCLKHLQSSFAVSDKLRYPHKSRYNHSLLYCGLFFVGVSSHANLTS